MNHIGTMIKLHVKDRWSWIYIPWIILLSSFFVNLIIGYFIRNIEPGGITTGGLASIFVYMFFGGLFVLHQTFAFALGFGVTRKDYFFGTSAMLGVIGVAAAIVLTLLAALENLTSGWGISLHFFHMPFLNEMGVLAKTLLYFWTIVHLYALGFVISSIHRRFGRSGMFTFFTILILISSVFTLLGTAQNWWVDLFHWLTQFTWTEIFTGLMLWQAVLSVVYLLFTYMMLRKSAI